MSSSATTNDVPYATILRPLTAATTTNTGSYDVSYVSSTASTDWQYTAYMAKVREKEERLHREWLLTDGYPYYYSPARRAIEL